MSDVDFHSNGETAYMVSCYFTRDRNMEVTGLVTSVLLRTRRSWVLRAQLFDMPRPAGGEGERFTC
jgi:hypothetical protein